MEYESGVLIQRKGVVSIGVLSGGVRGWWSSVVVKVGYTAVSRNLSVDMSTLLLVEIDLRLQNVDLLSLALKLRTEQVLLHLDLLLVFLVLVAEQLLVGAVQLLVKLQLLSAELLDHVQQVGIAVDLACQVTLSSSQISLSLLLLEVASLFHLVELVLQVKHDLGRTRHLERVQVHNVAETKHLTLAVLSDLLIKLLLVL